MSSRPASRLSDVPKPEAGIAEWASKIKALQRQVDEDDEAEQKKLEEEIAASRIKRLRRSQLYGGNSRPQSLELATPIPESDTPNEPVDRQRDQADALRALTGEMPRARSPLAPSKSEPVSLAAFIGGRATGPRLNKHTPQQDAHDPTQFEQRTHVSAPHPIFGRGGVAMPGMVSKGRAPTLAPLPEHVPSPPVERSISTPPASVHQAAPPAEPKADVVEQTPPKPAPKPAAMSTGPPAQSRVDVPKPTTNGHGLGIRDISQDPPRTRTRTLSTPTGRAPSPSLAARAPSPLVQTPVHTPPSSLSTPSRAPRRSFQPAALDSPSPTTTPSKPAPSKPPVSTPSLARPLQPPSPSPKQYGPHIKTGAAPSAFLRTQTPKAPTPSLTRLKGRGFVQNMVKSTLEKEAGAASPPAPDSSGSSSGRKLANVLNRWPAAQTQGQTPSPPEPPKSPTRPLRKSWAPEPSPTKSASPAPMVIRPYEPKQPRPLASPTIASVQPMEPPSPTKARHGSSNTLISYIKPTKTGDGPAPRPKTPQAEASRARTPQPQAPVDEFGMAHAQAQRAPVPSVAAPLSHPTKDRAKLKRNKGKTQTPPVSRVLEVVHEDAGKPKEEEAKGEAAPAQPPPVQAPAIAVAEPAPVSAPAWEPEPPSPAPEVAAEPSRTLPTPPATTRVLPTPPATARALPPPPETASKPSIADRWAAQPLIGVKTVKTYEQLGGTPRRPEGGMVGRRALPGMVLGNGMIPPVASTPAEERPEPEYPEYESSSPSRSPVPPSRSPVPGPVRSPPPARHSRIPSTGTRATVMEVSHLFSEEARKSPTDARTESPEAQVIVEAPVEPVVVEAQVVVNAPVEPTEEIVPVVVEPTPRFPAAPAIERRRSSYDKYAPFMMPPVEEERSPMSTVRGARPPPVEEVQVAEKLHTRLESIMSEASEADVEPETRTRSVVHFEHADRPLPRMDVGAILKARVPGYTTPADVATVSLDVMAVVGTNATPIEAAYNVFYDTDVIAVIHRSKSKASGLVATQVWAWRGRRAQLGEREERKLAELAKRYGTAMIAVAQHGEPAQLLAVLGGQLAIRQGTRAHWSAENTAMHLVRAHNGGILIDEHDLSLRNLCSAFSYCLSVLDTVYVWHGCGSLDDERDAAVAYATDLAGEGGAVVELVEGESDDDEMFWMMLGDEEYARADYWRWRREGPRADPRVWRIEPESKEVAHLVPFIAAEPSVSSSVYVVDCIWEFFVLVGTEARADRHAIRTALSLAMAMSDNLAPSRPFAPRVHVVVLPSQLPADLRLAFRDMDEVSLNDGGVPEHMNILSATEALEHLARPSWDRAYLRDYEFLPLGLHASNLP